MSVPPRGGTDSIARVLRVTDRSTRYRAVVLTHTL
jgi:hypothetical protein